MNPWFEAEARKAELPEIHDQKPVIKFLPLTSETANSPRSSPREWAKSEMREYSDRDWG